MRVLQIEMCWYNHYSESELFNYLDEGVPSAIPQRRIRMLANINTGFCAHQGGHQCTVM